MTVLRSCRLLLTVLASVALLAAACSGSEAESGNGAIASSGDESGDTVGNDQSQDVDSDGAGTGGVDADRGADTTVPPEGETGVGDDPVNGGGEAQVDEPDPVVASDDGLSTDLAAGDDQPVGPSMPAEAAEFCAVVEFAYLGLLDGDAGVAVQERLREGATAAASADDQRYASAGADLLEAVGTDGAPAGADALLAVCALDGFERLA